MINVLGKDLLSLVFTNLPTQQVGLYAQVCTLWKQAAIICLERRAESYGVKLEVARAYGPYRTVTMNERLLVNRPRRVCNFVPHSFDWSWGWRPQQMSEVIFHRGSFYVLGQNGSHFDIFNISTGHLQSRFNIPVANTPAYAPPRLYSTEKGLLATCYIGYNPFVQLQGTNEPLLYGQVSGLIRCDGMHLLTLLSDNGDLSTMMHNLKVRKTTRAVRRRTESGTFAIYSKQMLDGQIVEQQTMSETQAADQMEQMRTPYVDPRLASLGNLSWTPYFTLGPALGTKQVCLSIYRPTLNMVFQQLLGSETEGAQEIKLLVAKGHAYAVLIRRSHIHFPTLGLHTLWIKCYQIDTRENGD